MYIKYAAYNINMLFGEGISQIGRFESFLRKFSPRNRQFRIECFSETLNIMHKVTFNLC